MTQIILNQPHTHAGVLHAIGTELDVLLHDAEYLVSHGIANFKRGPQKRTAPPPLPDLPADATTEPTTEPSPTGDST